MYSREVDGRERTFGVSGRLWHGVLVMFDRETDTFWTQLDGRAIQGPDHGEELDHVPSTFTTWAAWRDVHPDTLVLEKTGEERGRTASHYADYFASDGLFRDDLAEGIGDEIEPKEVVFGVVRNGDALAVTEALLEELAILNTEVGGEPVALLRDARTGAVRAFFRHTDGGVLELEPLEEDPSARTAFDRARLEAVSVADLRELRVDRAFWYAWARSHPDSRALFE